MKRFIILLLLFPFLKIDAQQSEIAYNFNAFSLNIYKEMKQKNENLFFSPYSINMVLRMLWEGSEGQTKKEFEKVLQFSDAVSEEDVIDFLGSPKKGDVDRWSSLRVANALWVDDKFNIRVLFQKEMQRKYGSDIYNLDFAQNKAATDTINKWVSDNTNELIKDILQPTDVNEATALVIANAIYFYGDWAHKFEKYQTKKELFYAEDKTTIETDFMHKTRRYRYYDDKRFQFISLPYKGYDKSFCVILPKKKKGLKKVEKKLKAEKLQEIFTTAKMEKIALSLPKCKLETNYDLINSLKGLGLSNAFSDAADFSGINEVYPLKVDKFKHKAFIEVDEEKTKAAAATAGSVTLTSASDSNEEIIEFIADHPYLFMIVDNKTNGILFLGRYAKPE